MIRPPFVPPARGQRPRRALLTGGAGFIGSHLATQLLAAGWAVDVVDDLSSGRRERVPAGARFQRADVTAPGRLAKIVAGFERCGETPDVVVHLAARVGVRRVLADPDACLREHRASANALIEALEELPAARRPALLAASTSEVYAEREEPLREGDPLRSSIGVGRWAYAASKLEAEAALDHATQDWPERCRPIHLRFFNVVGPGQDASSGMVLPRFVEQVRAGRALSVHGDGAQVRTFAHVDEVATALGRLMDAVRPRGGTEPLVAPGPLNLGGVARASVLELALLVTHLAGGGRIEHVDPLRSLSHRFEEVRHREPCLERARALGLPACERDLEAIVRDTLARHPRARAAAGALGRASG